MKNHKKLHISKTIYLKLFWSYSEVNEINWSTEPVCEKFQDFNRFESVSEKLSFSTSYLSFEVLKLINSFHGLNRFRKNWVFQASYLSFEVLKLINSFYSWIGLWKIEFFKQAIWVLKFWSLSIHVIVWIGLWKVEVFEQTISAVKVFNFSKLLSRRNWFPIFFMQATQA